MISKQFIVDELSELRAMQRVFREAKFCIEADDDEISESPVVASLFRRLMVSLIEAEVITSGESARKSWEAWLSMDDPNRDEWSAALRRARKQSKWEGLTLDEKRAYAKLLLSPFLLSDRMTQLFLESV